MSYKGNDLDLRAPDERPPEASPEPGADLRLSALQLSSSGRQATIAVDRTVLACCNLAYDIAAFHAARADLCRRLGRKEEAIASYGKALALSRQEPERRERPGQACGRQAEVLGRLHSSSGLLFS